jgi:hypothetical protein
VRRAISAAITRVLSDVQLRQALVSLGGTQRAKSSSYRMAEQYRDRHEHTATGAASHAVQDA